MDDLRSSVGDEIERAVAFSKRLDSWCWAFLMCAVIYFAVCIVPWVAQGCIIVG